MYYDFSKVTLTDSEGNEVDEKINKPISEVIFSQVKSLELVEVARKIFAGEEVELDNLQIKEVRELICGEKSSFHAFAKKAIKDYIKDTQSKK